MKLYYLQGACSLASHIMLKEVGAEFDIELVDPAAGRTASGQNYRDINPNGYVPALDVGNSIVLSEGVAVLQYIADSNPDKAFSPALGSVSRARLHQFLNFGAAELHKSWSPLFSDASTDLEKTAAAKKVAAKFDYLESELSDGRDFLVENQFSVADAYIFVLSNWANFQGIDLKAWPNLAKYVDRIMARPATQAAMQAEGLI
ncbi:MAG: glutathione S-transferase C-terminal domain-containing protein [Henriciella sp.]